MNVQHGHEVCLQVILVIEQMVHTEMMELQYSKFVTSWLLFSKTKTLAYFLVIFGGAIQSMLMAIDTLIPLVQKYECDIAVKVRKLHEWMGTERILFFLDFTKLIIILFLMPNLKRNLMLQASHDFS